MDNNSTYEQEIDLKDLMFAVLHRWRPVLLVAVLLAILLGGAKAALTYRAQNDPEKVAEAEKTYRDDLELYEKNKKTAERELENLKTDIENQQEYMEKSIWINMSPYDVCEAKIDMYIATDYTIMPGMIYQNPDYTNTILDVYRAMLTSSAVMEDVAAALKSEPRYLQELVTVDAGSNHILSISAKHTTKEAADKLLDALLDHMQSMQEQVTASVGAHTISTVNRSVSTYVDLTLADTHKTEADRLTALNTSLEEKQKELDDMEEPKNYSSSRKLAVKSGIKFFILGGLVGGFMAVFFVCAVFIVGDTVYSAKELKKRFGVTILGALPIKKGKAQCKVDAWLNRMEGRAVSGNEAVEFSLIAANIRNYTDNMSTILVTGSADAAVVKQAADKLIAELPEMKVLAGGNMLEDVDTLKRLPECDGVVLIEQCRDSKYSVVGLEMERITDLQKRVVGCVVFE